MIRPNSRLLRRPFHVEAVASKGLVENGDWRPALDELADDAVALEEVDEFGFAVGAVLSKGGRSTWVESDLVSGEYVFDFLADIQHEAIGFELFDGVRQDNAGIKFLRIDEASGDE